MWKENKWKFNIRISSVVWDTEGASSIQRLMLNNCIAKQLWSETVSIIQ